MNDEKDEISSARFVSGLVLAAVALVFLPLAAIGVIAVLDDDSGRELVAIVGALEADGAEVHGDRLKTAPRGIDPSHARIGLLRHRTLLVSRDHGTPEWLETPEAIDRVRDDWRAFGPLNAWLARHLDG